MTGASAERFALVSVADRGNWLTADEFARLIQCSSLEAQRILKRCVEYGACDGVALNIGLAASGGAGCESAYLIQKASVPTVWPSSFVEPSIDATLPRQTTASNQQLSQWKAMCVAAVERARATDGYSLKEAIRAVAKQHAWLAGTKCGRPLSPSTLEKWYLAHARQGASALQRKTRFDKGSRKVIITKRIDELLLGIGHDDAKIKKYEETVIANIRGSWGNGAASWEKVAQMVAGKIYTYVRDNGYVGSPAELRKSFAITRRMVEKERSWTEVATFRSDYAKASSIEIPRIKRTREGLAPGQYVAGDVHHIDVLLTREDGTQATPKMVVWLCLGTNRIFVDFYLLPKGEMIRREHIVRIPAMADSGSGDGGHCRSVATQVG